MTPSTKKTESWIVHKFGGTSVGNAERYAKVAQILANEKNQHPKHRQAVVVSAMKGVTDDLIDAVKLASQKNGNSSVLLEKVKIRHQEALQSLGILELEPVFEKDFLSLHEILKGIRLMGTASESIVEFVSGHGEVWSAQILSAYLQKRGNQSRYLDARNVLVIAPSDGNPSGSVLVQWEASEKKLLDWLSLSSDEDEILVITGFVASTADGVATTLKRNGSDFSASIFGRLFDASEIIIWTDVDGVLSADPRLVPDAIVLDEMTYYEMTELANFGAKVVHPATMEPAIRKGIPIWIRNTFRPDFPGTKIHANARSKEIVKGFSAIEKMALINIEGTGLVGVSGMAERLFGALRSAGISVVMISQASSEHSICFAIQEEKVAKAKAAIEKAFYAEIHQGTLDPMKISTHKSIIAAVGDNMVEKPGVSGQFFSALGRSGVNIHAIAQGASERNISAVIDGKDTRRALRTAHAAFYLSPQTLGIALVGVGLIGKEFLKQLKDQLPTLKKEHGIDLRVRAISDSKKMLLDGSNESGLSLEDWKNQKGVEATDLAKMLTYLRESYLPHSVMIDATASSELPLQYPQWLRSGFHVITPNKKANTQAYPEYQELRRISKETKRRFLYSTNVCAGLPVLQSVREMIRTGDQIKCIEGVLSGTLSYLFNSYDGRSAFSKVVLKAKELGYTEPDPRDDLSGVDVARKLVIVAREAGLMLELHQIKVESLADVSDEKMNERFQAAKSKNQVLRYVGKLDEKGSASVRLDAYPMDHAFARLGGADNIVSFRSMRYHDRPLIIQGPGAGPEVTAGGVFADLLRLVSSLGGNS